MPGIMEMNEKQKIHAGATFMSVAMVGIMIVGLGAIKLASYNPDEIAELSEAGMAEVKQITAKTEPMADYKMRTYPWQELGYASVMDYHNDLKKMNEDAVGIYDEAVEKYSVIITDEQKERLYDLESEMTSTLTMRQYNEYLDEFNGILDECEESLQEYLATQAYSHSSNSSGSSSYYSGGDPYNFKRDGVVYSDGTRYTWYSSNVLYHYRTGEWTAGDDGFYRDSNGYIIVASNDHAQGTIVNTPWGEAIVEDSGCASGTLDIYTNY